MRKYLTGIILFIVFQSSSGQEKNDFFNHQVTADFGSFRNRYLYPITDLKYSSPVWQKANLQFSARLRSYGTLYFFSKSAYDFTPLAAYYFTKTVKPVYFSAGIGLDTRIRLVHDERSEATNSAEPFVSLTLHSRYKKLTLNAPLWTRFFSNGISFALAPEASYKIGEGVSLFLRYELSYLTVYKVSTHEWRQDSFIGTHVYF